MEIWGLPLYVSELPCVPLVLRILVFLSFLDMFSNILTKHLLTFIIRLKWNSSFWSFQILLFDLFRTTFLTALLAQYSPSVVTSLLYRVTIIKQFFNVWQYDLDSVLWPIWKNLWAWSFFASFFFFYKKTISANGKAFNGPSCFLFLIKSGNVSVIWK